MRCPFALWRPITTNHGGHMSEILGLVLHVQEGNGSLYGWFNNPASQVSAHFWISKAGTLEQYVDTDLVAWAEAAGNPNYLSVETEGFVAEPLTPAQLEQASQLFLWVTERYNVPLEGPVPHGSRGLTPHCNPDGTVDPAWGGHSCPGGVRLGQMPAIVAGATPAPPTQEELDTMTSVVLPNGKVLISAAGAGSREGHLLVWTFDPVADKATSVIDATTGVGGADPFLVSG